MRKILDFFSPILACDLGYYITMALLVVKCKYGDGFPLSLGVCVAPALLQFCFVMLALYCVARRKQKDKE